MSEATETKQESVDLQQLAMWSVVGAVVAAVVNAIIFTVTQGQFEGTLVMGEAFELVPVIIASIVGVVGGGILLAILDRFLSSPISTWRWIAIAFLIISFGGPFAMLEGEPTMTARIILSVMHIITAGLAIYLLTTRTAKSA